RHRLAADDAREAPRARVTAVGRDLLRGVVDRAVAVQVGDEDEPIGAGLAHGREAAGGRVPPRAPYVEAERFERELGGVLRLTPGAARDQQARARSDRCGQGGEHEQRERRADQHLDHGEAAGPPARYGGPAHWTLTRPRWFTITLRVRAPAARVMVAFSALPSPPKRTRLRPGRAAKPTPGGSRRVSSST